MAKAPQKNAKKPDHDHHWTILLVVIIAVLTTTTLMNLDHLKDDLHKIDGTINTDDGDEDINWDRYNITNLELSQSVEITKPGIYHLTGALSDGAVRINVGSEGVAKLILDQVSITNSAGPAIACYAADDLVIETIGENFLEDGADYAADLDTDVKGVIYSKSDLTFTGDGKLVIKANHEDGIVSKDDLKFVSGDYQITAKDDAIRGKDSVYIMAGNFNLTAGADAIKSTNETDHQKGFVLIKDGYFDLTATAKGIKAINSILIYGGDFNIKTRDDAIHSNNYLGISDGNFQITSGDDGFHADSELIIDGGNINIAQSYEGLEAQKITINHGKITIAALDDGINAGGGKDGSANNRPGAGAFDTDENCAITINGGDIAINASGDGIDSNGTLYFNGGSTIVDGPTSNNNGALDAGLGAYIFGGEVVAVGANGMAVALSSDSPIFNLSIYFSTTHPAGTSLTIKDSVGQTIISHTTAKAFSHATIGSDRFTLGETYTIYIDGSTYQSFTISGTTTTLGQNPGDFRDFRR